MIKNICFLTTLILLILTTSCASILTGSKRNVFFESVPNGAKVFVNGIEKGVTPKTIRVKADDRIDFRISDYQEKVVVMDSNFNAVAILNGFNILAWGIDALTGSLKRVDTKYVRVTLDKKDKASLHNYLENGNISHVNVNHDDKVVETYIVLKK